MSYDFNHLRKSELFKIMLDTHEPFYVEKGSIIKVEGRRCEVLSVRKITFGKGLATIQGKCREVI